MRRFAGMLLNDWLTADSRPLILLFDDLHTVNDKLVHRFLDYLLENLFIHVHIIVVTTRYDPPLALARLRARGQLAEIRTTDLRFSFNEAKAFLNDHLALNLADNDVQQFMVHTDGWATGIRFDEVLAQQEPSLRQFLLESPFLSELTTSLCQAVTQQPDAERTLDTLYRRNLFVTESSVDDRTTISILRFHDLFAEFLRRRLHQERSPQKIEILHRRAAQAASSPAVAVYHYLTVQAWNEVISVIVQVGREQVEQAWVHIPGSWLNPLDMRQSEPWLRLLEGSMVMQAGRNRRCNPEI